jgi:hypothetical protein
LGTSHFLDRAGKPVFLEETGYSGIGAPGWARAGLPFILSKHGGKSSCISFAALAFSGQFAYVGLPGHSLAFEQERKSQKGKLMIS